MAVSGANDFATPINLIVTIGAAVSTTSPLHAGTVLVANPHVNTPLTRRTTNNAISIEPRAEDVVCFSHLRWKFVFQRPQHLLTRAARTRRVFYVEEPCYDAHQPCLEVERDGSGVIVVTPHVPPHAGPEVLQMQLDFLFSAHQLREYVCWYYTPMALEFTSHLRPVAIVYDCMDELSAFDGAPSALRGAERALLLRADLVLTGGHSLYLAKRELHRNVHEFPSSVDVHHFVEARSPKGDPEDQAGIGSPRIGFFGVIDERLDRPLLDAIAARSPGWHFVLVGPVTKVDRKVLPVRPNIHYLGPKTYDELPSYIAGWDVAMLPFARTEATRFISPTKTPEYLAAGRPVVSTSIADVVRPYGELGFARIADEPDHFTEAIRQALCDRSAEWWPRVDAFLAHNSWDLTWSRIAERLRAAVLSRRARAKPFSTQALEQRSPSVGADHDV